MLSAIVHNGVGLFGILLLYCAFFLKETEEGQYQNRLDLFWTKVDDFRKLALTKQAAFLKQATSLLSACLNSVFGERLFSLKALSTSLWFSLASVALAEFLGQGLGLLTGRATLWYLVVLVACVALGFSRPLIRHLALVLLLIALVLAMLYVYMLGGEVGLPLDYEGGLLLGILSVPVGAVVPDLLFITLNRWFLRMASKLSSAWVMSFLLLLNLGLTTVFAYVTYSYFQSTIVDDVPRFNQSVMTLIMDSNLLTLLMMISVVLFILTALAHRLIWPIVERPVYAASRFGIFKRHALLGALGASCVLYAWPDNPLVFAVAKAVHAGK